MYRIIVLILICLSLYSCKPATYIPKPRGFFNITFPKHDYKAFDQPGFPYSFEYASYANVIKDTSFFGQKPENPYWIYVDYPSLGGRLYISYKEISGVKDLAKMLEDTHYMSYFHSKKADYIEEPPFKNPNGVSGILYTIGGNAASAYQFIATDSVHHFLRGALYFDVTPNADSLRPVNEFIKKDIEHMLYTLKWK